MKKATPLPLGISSGKEKVVVPNLYGETYDESRIEALLESKGLKLGRRII